MKFKINFEKLLDIMQAFYSLTNIKIVIFDAEHNIICSYPESDCTFCKKIKSIPTISEKCANSDLQVFNKCKKEEKLILYTCHAGLVEACAPLKQNGIVIGYIMFGQISDLPCRDALNQNISSVCKEYGLNETEFLRVSKTIKLKSYESIMATAKIFEACISYIILNEMFLPEHDKIILESESFIDNHLENVSVTELYKHLNISRTALYEIFKKKTGLGVTEFIRKKQFEKANQLLKETDLPINDIANLCGFNDYNYFSRVFKKRYGISPKNIRKL